MSKEHCPFALRRIEPLLREAAQRSGYRVDELLGPSRKQHISMWRHVIWYVAYQDMSLTQPALGGIFGRDHTTIRYGIEMVGEKWKLYEPVINRLSRGAKDLRRRSFMGTGYPLKQVRLTAKDGA